MNSIWAVVPAAGSGRRLGGEIPKQYREIAGAPLMEHTLRALLESPDIRGIVVRWTPQTDALTPSRVFLMCECKRPPVARSGQTL